MMYRRVFISGVLGFVVLLAWGIVVTGVFRLNSRINMKTVQNEGQTHFILQENISAPGRYVVNPALTLAGAYPTNEPVFSVFYSGVGHGSARALMLLQFAIFFLAPLIAAYLLSLTKQQILTSYPRKVLYFTAIGLLFAVFGDLMTWHRWISIKRHTDPCRTEYHPLDIGRAGRRLAAATYSSQRDR